MSLLGLPMTKSVGEVIDDLSCFNRGTPVHVTVCPIDGENQEITDVYADGTGVVIQIIDNEDKSEKLFEQCLCRDWNVSITWQKVTDWSIEIYTGYKTRYKKIFYTDGHTSKAEAIAKALKFFEEL